MFRALTRVGTGLVLVALLGGCVSTPRYQGVDSDQLFQMGASAFQEDDWNKAIDIFERLIFQEPSFSRIVEARMYLARSYFNKGEYLTSVSEFTRVLDRYPDNPLAGEASLGACKSFVAQSPDVQRDQTFTAQAWNACQNTYTDFRGTAVAEEALALRDEMEMKLAEKIYIGGEFYFRRKFYHSGIIYFNDVLDQYPRNKWAAFALLRLHQSYSALGWDPEAQEARERLLRDFPDSEAAREVRAEDGGADEAGGGGGGGGSPGLESF